MKLRIISYIFFLIPIFTKAELQYSHKGYFDVGTIHRLSDGSIIKIPYRMLTYEPTISYNNYYLVTSTAVEFRLNDINDILGSDFIFDLRELYFEWITPLGEFSIGKQIISWGSASANNPTDNISPYNYYYLFSQGKEQKEGIFAFNSTVYFEDLKISTVLVPEHNTNVIPFGDSEFSIGAPIKPKDEQIMKIENPFEYGISITMPIQSIDITTSYFSGYDRLMSSFGANIWAGANLNPEILEGTIDTVLSYRHTKMFGLGFSTYYNDISIKGDIGYFITDDETMKTDSSLYRYWESGIERIIQQCLEFNEASAWDNDFIPVDCETDPTFNNSQLIDNRATYYQYTLEMEYAPTYDFIVIGQITSHHLVEIGIADSIKYSGGSYQFDPEDYFIPGLGAPNTFMSSTKNLLNSQSISISAQKSFPDNGYEIGYLIFYDLKNHGSINEFRIDYKITDNLSIMGAINKIQGNRKILNNQFSSMEDFSHIRMELKYYY